MPASMTPPLSQELQPAFLLDRDGVLIEEVGYLDDPDRAVLLPTVADAIRLARRHGYGCYVVTNQAGVARGYFGLEVVTAIHTRIVSLLAASGVAVDGFYVCPHHPEGQPPWRLACDCRKPLPGLLNQAAREHRLDLERSFLIGDKVTDLQAGAAAGCRTVLVRTGYGPTEAAKLAGQQISCKLLTIADTLLEAVQTCLAQAHGGDPAGVPQ